jgi:hypothetical protein
MVRALCLAVCVGLACGCSATGSGASSGDRSTEPLLAEQPAQSVGRPLRSVQVVAIGRTRPGGVGYASEPGSTAYVSVIDAQRSVPRGPTATVIRVAGIGAVSVRCSGQASASFGLTGWALGEGPPRVTSERVQVSGRTSLAGLAASFAVPDAEARNQLVQEWRVSQGGGEAFQFTATITTLLTVTVDRCDVLGEATVVTTGVFARYAPGHKVY